ncbi:MAG: glyceraldehyde 3-phosphate dehydrogenase NAD-binding domain-containing protein, partial [Bacteroidota bacterium]
MKRIAINGFGRIGRVCFRHLLKNEHVEVVAINDLTDVKTLAHLLKYDSIHGRVAAEITCNDDALVVNGKAIRVYAQIDPAQLPWDEIGVDV